MRLLTSSLLLTSSWAQDVPGVPGLQEWRQAQAQVLEAERRLGQGEAAPQVTPGIAQWRAHQAATLQAERLLEDGEAEAARTEPSLPSSSSSSSSEKSATASDKQTAALNELRSLLQTSIKRFLSKSKQQTNKIKEGKLGSDKSSNILTLLSNFKSNREDKSNQGSYLDQLIKTYKTDSRSRNHNSVTDFDFLIDETLRSRSPLSRLEFFDDPYVSRSRSLYQEDIDEALLESRLLDRELKKMLRRIKGY